MAVAGATILAVVAGCGGGDDGAATQASSTGAAALPRGSAPTPKPATCAAATGNCQAASGTIVYVEAVDPDGDGDAHFVLLSPDGVTGPGVSVIDVERELRPHPLPSVGDAVSAAGPVYPGSYGQHQIQAVELHVARAG